MLPGYNVWQTQIHKSGKHSVLRNVALIVIEKTLRDSRGPVLNIFRELLCIIRENDFLCNGLGGLKTIDCILRCAVRLRDHESRAFVLNHLFNAALDLQLTMSSHICLKTCIRLGKS